MVKSSNKQPDNFKKVKYTYDNKTITFVTHMWCLFAWFALLIRIIPYRCINTWYISTYRCFDEEEKYIEEKGHQELYVL